MSYDGLRNALQVGEVVVGGLEAIEKLTHVGGDKAEHALHAIRSMLIALREGVGGKMSPQAVLTHIESLGAALASNDAAVDAVLE